MSRDVSHPSAPAPAPDPHVAAEAVPVDAGAEPPRPRRRRWAAGAAVGLVAVAVVGWSPWGSHGDVRDGTTAVSRSQMAARQGVDVNLVALTAAGGLVELRMQVVDTDKAYAVLHDADQRPVIVSEDTGETLRMAAPSHRHGDLQLGGQYFFLLANAHNAIRAGGEVTLVIGGSRLEHVEVQG
ncbi:MAG TPA: hypothetical protein VFT70_17740 [Nocardioides sp.]|nr:hypothetical protein [Nocardioides sp.]